MRGSWIDSSTVTSTTSRFPGHRGDKIMAAVMHRRPEFAARLACAEGMAPFGARVFKKGLSFGCLGGHMFRNATPWSAPLFTMIGLSAYTRPGALLRCRVCNLVKTSLTIAEHWTLLLNPEERRGLCSRTRKPHFKLTGSNHLGIPWTRVAQPYPSGLCRDLASSLTSPSHYNPPLQ